MVGYHNNPGAGGSAALQLNWVCVMHQFRHGSMAGYHSIPGRPLASKQLAATGKSRPNFHVPTPLPLAIGPDFHMPRFTHLCLLPITSPIGTSLMVPPGPAVMDGLLSSLDDPALALVQWNEAYAVVADRLPAAVALELEAAAAGGWLLRSAC